MNIFEYKKDGKKAYGYKGYLGKDKLTGKTVNISRQGFMSKREAKASFEKERDKFKNGVYGVDFSKMRVRDLYEKWLKVYRPTVRYSTYEGTVIEMEKHVLPYIGDRFVTKFTRNHAQDYVSDVCSEKNRGERHYRRAKRLFKYALTHLRIIDENPFEGLELPKFQKEGKNLHFLEKEEIGYLEGFCRDLKTRLAYRIFVHGGLRQGELRVLTRDDFLFDTNQLVVNKTATKDESGGETIGKTKTVNGDRVIYLDSLTMELAKEYLSYSKSKYIFAYNRHRSFPSGNTMQYMLDKVTKSANFRRITPHVLRHTHATQCLDSGMNLKQVSDRLGDDMLTVSKVYAHATAKGKKESIDNYEKFMDFE